MKLFEVTNSRNRKFYVVCDDEAQAARAAENQWSKWGYFSSHRTVVSTKLLANEEQYCGDGVTWLIVRAGA